MALIKSVRGYTPKIGENVFLADNATVIGDVEIGKDCSIWFNTVLRGDVNTIKLGNKVNIQDGSVLHTLYQKSTIEIGNNVSVGHNATIHGAKICDNVLVGIDHHTRRCSDWRKLHHCRQRFDNKQHCCRTGQPLCRCACEEDKRCLSGTDQRDDQ